MANEEKKTNVPATPAKAVPKNPDQKLGFGARVKKWFREMKSELSKVIWPTPKQTLNNTIVALSMMAAAAIVIGGFDYLASTGIKALITLLG